MKSMNLGRRKFLQLGLLTGLSGLSGCKAAKQGPSLRATAESLPKEWRRMLPNPWRYIPIKNSRLREPFKFELEDGADVLALNDGWLLELSKETLQPIDKAWVENSFDYQAKKFLSGLGGDLAPRVLPIGVSPWVLLFRNGNPWLEEARLGWEVLLNPALKDLVVLPRSPRLVMDLADRMDVDESLYRLRRQVLTFDDRYGLNWLLQGQARVVVLPFKRCLPILRKDPRLNAVLPQSGAPLNWTVLVHSAKSLEPFPVSWLKNSLRSPLLNQLLRVGWIPPVKLEKLRKEPIRLAETYREIILPSQSVWSNCWSLPPLTEARQVQLEERWSQSSP